MNYRLIATNIGHWHWNNIEINYIGMIANALFPFQKESFPNDFITSETAKLIYDWILTLAKQNMEESKINELLYKFIKEITPNTDMNDIYEYLNEDVVEVSYDTNLNDFVSRNYHSEININCERLFNDGHYFHAVFEASKVYNKLVKEKSQSNKDGSELMMSALNKNGVLKFTRCESDTDINVQEGIMHLSAGLMRAIRNPQAHEPAIDWNMNNEDCLDILSLISYLLKQLDNAIYCK
ncbi:MAG: TIGR02391 family protein [Nitrospirae bacterium]|nr:TIGR02391 family protein [Nitrospirota bacterium]MBF0535022.1 TIGR02391 family protein [Nitrospirota bacterium]MBF0616530.1 TIGR02391 family protein [Nitrospirota bacterium]